MTSSHTDARFKTMRHIETVRNYINLVVRELLRRGEEHDQSKLEEPERSAYDQLTAEMAGVKYGTPEYKAVVDRVRPAVEHHQANNRHHPEFFHNGIRGMSLIDLIEMLADWKASGLRSEDGDLLRSIEIGQSRFGYTDELREILENTARWMNDHEVFHKATES